MKTVYSLCLNILMAAACVMVMLWLLGLPELSLWECLALGAILVVINKLPLK
jgi:hypothetical protein